MNVRMNTFDVPHKGIRNGLAQLAILAGKTDYDDLKEVSKLNTLGKEVFLMLNTHAEDENDVSLKYLEQKMKGASLHDVEDHARLHAIQAKLEKTLDEIYRGSMAGRDVKASGASFYSSFADYHAEYLLHMSGEERITQQLLWDNFTDEELAEHRTEIIKKLPPDTLLLWFKFIAPAQSHAERTGFFTGFKKNAPPELFEKACVVLKNVLDEEEWNRLNAEI